MTSRPESTGGPLQNDGTEHYFQNMKPILLI
jgi:hypothetical protein